MGEVKLRRKQRAVSASVECWMRVQGVVELVRWVAGGWPCLCGMGVSAFYIAAYTGAQDAGSEVVDEGRKQDAGSKQRMIPSSAEGQRERGDTFCHGSKPETLVGLGSQHSANRTRPPSALPLSARPHGIVFISARSYTLPSRRDTQ